jgi:exodeoxyribonuclease V alpha subunit
MNKSEVSTFNGIIGKVYSHDKDTGFSIMQVRPADDDAKAILAKYNGGKNYISVLGVFFKPIEGGMITSQGAFTESPKFGIQFKADNIFITSLIKKSYPEDGLRSRLFEAIGKKKKEDLILKFGRTVLLDINSDKFLAANIVTANELSQLRNELFRFLRVSDTFDYLRGLGFRIDAIDSILESFGNAGKEIIANDPYRLLAVTGVGFGNIDNAAVSMGMEMTSMKRIKHGFGYIIKNHMENGHTAFYLEEMVKKISSIMDLDADVVKGLLTDYVKSGHYMITSKNDKLLLIDYATHKVELDCAIELKRLMRGKKSLYNLPIILDTDYLKEGQVKAIKNSLSNKVSIITGGPGVGKTTVVKTILDLINAGSIAEVISLAAPTGQASERMFNATGIDASTIHSILDYHPELGFRKNSQNKLVCTTIVIDELSMVDIHLFYALLCAIPDECQVIFVGDVDQLPSIGQGAVLGDLIRSRRIAVSKLTEVTRVDKDSTIPKNAHLINSGKMPDLSNSSNDFHWIDANSDSEILGKIGSLITAIPGTFNLSFNSIQVLTPQKGTLAGVDSLNKEIRKIINPNPGSSRIGFMSFGTDFRDNDRIIVTKNNRRLNVNNGEVGLIKCIDYVKRVVDIAFSKITKQLPFSFFSDIKHAFAKTIHKSQGSEYDVVIIPISESHAGMLNIQLLYTGVTRAKKHVFMVGSKLALENALQNRFKERRITMLDVAIDREMSSSLTYESSSSSGARSFG